MNGLTRIIMVTGGQRSGKSEFAEKLTLSLSSNPLYLATARVLDSEMERRVELHRRRRGDEWSCAEHPLHPSKAHGLQGKIALLDCITMLATNHFLELDCDCAQAAEAMIKEIDALLDCGADTIIAVTNEIGLGGINADPVQRAFTDLQGRVNSYLASKAEEVYMIVSGLPLKLK